MMEVRFGIREKARVVSANCSRVAAVSHNSTVTLIVCATSAAIIDTRPPAASSDLPSPLRDIDVASKATMSLARTARLFTTTRFAAGPAVRSAQFVRFKSDDTADIPTENIPAQNPKFLKRTTETQGPSVVPDVAGTQHGGEEGLHTRPATDHGTRFDPTNTRVRYVES